MTVLLWDLLVSIFAHADTSTLAVLGRVSLDFLQSTSPLLYREVELTSLASLRLLFYGKGREPVSNPTISRLLLSSQIKTLSLNFASLLLNPPSLPQNPLAPTSPHDPIPLSILTITTSFSSSTLLRHLYASYLPLLNPIRLSLAVHDRPFNTSPEFYLGSNLPFLAHFTRLESLELRGSIPYAFARPESYGLAALPPPTVDRRRRVRLVIASLLYEEHSTVTSFVGSSGGWHVLGLKTVQKGSVVLVVKTEGEKTEAKRAVEGLEEAWRGCFAVEVGH